MVGGEWVGLWSNACSKYGDCDEYGERVGVVNMYVYRIVDVAPFLPVDISQDRPSELSIRDILTLHAVTPFKTLISFETKTLRRDCNASFQLHRTPLHPSSRRIPL